jgi:intracellular multiplication protein IcmT
MAQEPTANAHWRDSARTAKFFVIDATAVFPLLLFLVHIALWTFIVAAVIIGFFATLNRFGFSMPVFFRVFRSFIAGPRKIAIPWWAN